MLESDRKCRRERRGQSSVVGELEAEADELERAVVACGEREREWVWEWEPEWAGRMRAKRVGEWWVSGVAVVVVGEREKGFRVVVEDGEVWRCVVGVEKERGGKAGLASAVVGVVGDMFFLLAE